MKSVKSFRARYLQEEETPQTVSNKIDLATDKIVNQTKVDKAVTPTIGDNAEIATVSPQQSIVNTGVAEANLNRSSSGRVKQPTIDDGNAAATAEKNSSIRATQNSSRTPFNAKITESELLFLSESVKLSKIDLDKPIRGKYANALTDHFDSIGLNTGFGKSRLSTKEDASKTGQKNINKGTVDSFKMGKRDLGRAAYDNVKNNQQPPKSSEIKTATAMESVSFIIGKLIEEYSNIDNKWGANAPGNRGRTVNISGVERIDHTKQTQNMVKGMNEVIQAKERQQAPTLKATMPEPDTDHAMEQTAGLHMQRSNIIHGADEANARVREEREQRLQAQQPQEQEQEQ